MNHEVTKGFILAAGKGTRMGPVGEFLPKPLWPLLGKTLLEIQVQFLKSLGIKEIFINVFHQADQFEQFIGEVLADELKVIREKELLDVGGAIHNLANQIGYEEKILILNSDTFFTFKDSEFKKMLLAMDEQDTCCLGTIEMTKGSGYTELVLDDHLKLKKLIKSHDVKNDKYFTYSGTSIVNLRNLTPRQGVSSFFDSVCDYQKTSVATYPFKDSEYWDLGTLEKYFAGLYRITSELISENHSQFTKFLLENKLIHQDLPVL
ncbi:MAG: NTP transferase domain-containing protein [Halobacteriovoraceae bacterium]|nr:NTP transferase domain-containing protein [Halobacteriovoraceae bacterium]